MAKVNIKSEKTTPFRLFYYSYVCRQENIILFIYITLLYNSAVRDSATTSKSENLGTGPRRGTLPDSLTRFSENCLYISSILMNFA